MTIIERLVAGQPPCVVIAEAGVNHNGDLRLAHALVDAAKRAGADVVKFQTFDPEALAGPATPKAAYQRETTGAGEGQLEMLRRLVLPADAHRELKQHAEDAGLEFLSSPFDESSADFLDALGVKAFKVASGEVTNHPFLAHLARKGRPLLLSTGMSDLHEVEEAVAAIRAVASSPLVLLHCVSSYPAPAASANLRAMHTLRERFRVPVGYSDHTLGAGVPVASVALGASVLEKHLTLDRTLPGPDHAASLEPDAFAAMVDDLRTVESALGDGVKVVQPCEHDVRLVARKSLHLARRVPAGKTLEGADLHTRRPANGLPPSAFARVIGRRARHDMDADRPLQESDLE
jgi:N,N'-diacetyllegionaminate synthase